MFITFFVVCFGKDSIVLLTEAVTGLANRDRDNPLGCRPLNAKTRIALLKSVLRQSFVTRAW